MRGVFALPVLATLVLLTGATDSEWQWQNAEGPAALLRTATDSVPLTMISHCTTSGCGDRGYGAELEQELAGKEVSVSPGAELIVEIRPASDSVAIGPGRILPALRSNFKTDSRTLHGLRITAPQTAGVYRYTVSAHWRDRRVTSSTRARWLLQIRIP